MIDWAIKIKEPDMTLNVLSERGDAYRVLIQSALEEIDGETVWVPKAVLKYRVVTSQSKMHRTESARIFEWFVKALVRRHSKA